MPTISTKPTPTKQSSPPSSSQQPRLLSIDVLRGFDMLWITGLKYFVIFTCVAAAVIPDRSAARSHWLLHQLEHVDWIGLQFYDLVFPLFLFLTGITIPLSITSKLESGRATKRDLTIRCIRRALLLIILGMIHQIHGLPLRWPSVLGFIGVSYFIAAMFAIYTPRSIQIAYIPTALLSYFIAIKYIPFNGHPAGTITEQSNFASYIDSFIIPAKHTLSQGLEIRKGITPTRPAYDPEGPFMAISGSALAMLGVAAGYILTNIKTKPIHRALFLYATSIACLLIAYTWSSETLLGSQHLPLIKKIWTPSFILAAAGYCFLLTATFYLVIDVANNPIIRKLCFPLQLYGQNALAVYMIGPAIGIFALCKSIFSPIINLFPSSYHSALIYGLILLTQLTYLYIFYRKKIYLRV
ncbi:DUF5009 domain-containing protein [Planctomycetota bacterium]|nr:DUF5009 domain-containing protein [Planctomycetota bacterium]